MIAQNRTPSGVPTGGQFAASAKGESSVTLSAMPVAKPILRKATDFDPDSPKYDVEVDGQKIGSVGRGWWRNGGTQWFNSVRGVLYPVGDTRAAAVAHLVRNAPDPDTTDAPALREPGSMTREELLDDNDLRFAPAEWLAEKSTPAIASMLTEMRMARLRATADRTCPDGMSTYGDGTYTTADGYNAHEAIDYSDGTAALRYRVTGKGADGSHTEDMVDDLPAAAQWFAEQRASRSASWTEAFPMTSPAARVHAFRGQRTGVWRDQSLIAADGSYVGVHEDDEPTGHWFIDGEWADGTPFDALGDSEAGAMAQAERILNGGKDAYERSQRW